MYENDSVRYCEIDAAKKLNCLSPSTSPKVTCVPPKMSPPLVTPTFTGGRPSRNIFSNVPFLRMFCLHQRVAERRLEVDDRPGRAEVDAGDGVQRLLRASSVWMPYSPL